MLKNKIGGAGQLHRQQSCMIKNMQKANEKEPQYCCKTSALKFIVVNHVCRKIPAYTSYTDTFDV